VKVLVVNDIVGNRSRGLAAALQRRGCETVTAALSEIAFDTGSPSGLAIPGFDDLPDAVLVRSVAAGSFEAITRRLGVLHAFRALGVPVWNSAQAIERCVDCSRRDFPPRPPSRSKVAKRQKRSLCARLAPWF
jgi:tetrahydromethanopterin:alpha-L-glutamate ligase